MLSGEQPGWGPIDCAIELAIEAEEDFIQEALDRWEAGIGLSLAEQLYLLQFAPLDDDTASDLSGGVDDLLGLDDTLADHFAIHDDLITAADGAADDDAEGW